MSVIFRAIELKEVDEAAFMAVLHYIYTDMVDLETMTENLLDVFIVSSKYNVTSLKVREISA